MEHARRRFLLASAALGASLAARAARADATPGRSRVVIVGGGWGGLTAACHLRRLAPQLDVTLVDRGAAFVSLPLSNRWLVGLGPDLRRGRDYAALGRSLGYAFVRAEVTGIDRVRRRVATREGSIEYDWLILAPGIRYDYAPWFGDDAAAAARARSHFPAGFVADELDALRRKIEGFAGGDLLMTVPPGPYRCAPAPYERAMMIAWLFRQRGIKGRLILVDHGPGMQAFNRVFADRYKDQVVHLTNAAIRSLDPFRKTVVTEFDDLRFDDAILIPAQQAGDLAWQAGLVARGPGGTGGWAGIDPVHLHVPDDDRLFLVGDVIDKVSPLFGHYPKNGHLANRLGRIAALEIAARAAGRTPQPQLPDSVCHVLTDAEPMESVRLEARYRFRGDGVIAQAATQHYDPQARGEDAAWAGAIYADMLGAE